jgi:Domain of unknown function (DUF1844)
VADQKLDESFKIIDRRLFTAQGELRKEALEQEKRERESAAALEPSAVRSGTSTSSGKAPAVPSGATGAASPGAAAEAPPSSRGFQMLVDFLARNAAALLGGYADPRTGQAILDLEGAREMIDMLDALREKTRGNLSPEDDHLLIEVLGSLKLSFLEMSKAAAQAMKEKAKSKT